MADIFVIMKDSSIALKTILPFSDNRIKQRNSDLEDEIPLIDNEMSLIEDSSSLSSRNRRQFSSSRNNAYSFIGGKNAQKARTISFPASGYLVTYFGPLCFVILITMGKEAYDDWIRYKRDCENNSQKYEILTRDGIKIVPSSKIKVGDLVVVHKDQRVPADLLLLRTTETSGACFIRTDQLDGEIDWKLRHLLIAVPFCQKLPSDNSLLQIDADIYADIPQKDIHKFVGNFLKQGMNNVTSQVEALSVENTLWMNTVLASGTAIGFVIYTGKDTRAVMNTSHPKTKIGLLDQEINQLSKILFLVTLLLSFMLIALNNFQGLWYIYLFRFLILFSSIIPIGLRVNLDMSKSVYAHQIMHDDEIPFTIVRTSTIPEEFGRINYLLSDKTGTLTKNDMELKKLHMGTISYNKTQSRGATHASVSLQTTILVGKSKRDMTFRVKDIILALALCHNVTPVVDTDNLVTYQASSPDEVAIVKWTESIGLTLIFRDINEMHLRTPHGNILEFKILQIFPFTSENKRMGIIVQDKQNEEIIFYEKGADVVMSNIVQYNDWLDEECGNFAREGLRTLVIACKKISEDVYNNFQERFHEAKISLMNCKAQQEKIISSILEQDLELLGLTGVEDKLQDGVKTTLELLRNAGLKIWMLTVRSPDEALEELNHLQSKGDCCLLYIDYYNNEFIKLAIRLPVVVAYYIKKLLGVGIVGKEGKQASLAADVSITQFSYLAKLLLWHGRNSYKCSAKLSQFVIHRGLIISVMQAVFSSIFYFAPIALYQGVLMVGYSTIYTMAPVFSLVLDKDVSEDITLQFPELYKDLTKNKV
ncbi:14786_t:CDS:10 [Entrophospora sp. SA101]|nr:14786_t:CDS:10 [Entrophospora sp. SA101]